MNTWLDNRFRHFSELKAEIISTNMSEVKYDKQNPNRPKPVPEIFLLCTRYED